MRNQSALTKPSMKVLRILVLICLTFGLAVPAAAQCKTYKLDVPYPAQKLQDGEHVIAAVETAHGKFEARVNVKGRVVSEPRFFLGGKPLKDTPEPQIAKPVRDCILKAEKAALSSGSWLANAARCTLNWFVPSAHAVDPWKCVATATCSQTSGGKYFCVAHACCSRSVGGKNVEGCAWTSGIY